jgi:hypothetical protein
MKILSFVLLLMVSMAFVLMGCSDNSAPIAAPTDQAAPLVVAPTDHAAPLDKPAPMEEKGKVTHFTAIEQQGTTLNPGYPLPHVVNGKMIITGMVADATWKSENKLVGGYIVMTLNGEIVMATGEGSFEGTFRLTPVGGHGGVWEGKCKGIRTMTNPSIPEWTSKWDEMAHGKGGKIDGMQLFSKEVITSWADQSYTGKVKGYYIKAHKRDEHRGPDDHR